MQTKKDGPQKGLADRCARPHSTGSNTQNEKSLFVSRDEVIAILASVGKRLLAVQYAMLERDHHFVKFAEQRHKFGNTELSRIGTDGTAGDATVAGALMRLPDKIHFEGGRILLLLLRRVPLCVFDNAFFVLSLALVGIQVGPGKIPPD